VVAARAPDCERGQASRDVSAGDQRYPAVGGGEPDLAAGAGAGQEAGEELAVDRCLAIETRHRLAVSSRLVYP